MRLLILLLLFPTVAPAQEALLQLPALLGQQTQTYDDCLLQNLKGVQSDLAASAIIEACERKYPDPKRSPLETRKRYQKLPPEAAQKIGGSLGELRGETLQVWLTNGAETWALARVVLGFLSWDPKTMEYRTLRLTSSPLKEQAWVNPGHQRVFEFAPMRAQDHFYLERWWVEEAEGYEVGASGNPKPPASTTTGP